jgi:citronellol/citronellal dehydrogenase
MTNFSHISNGPNISTGNLRGKTLFVTGASRGIGQAIALRAAKDGANIIIAAKTSDPHPKLAGTIYQTLEEVEKLGGKGLACVVDVRDEESVHNAVRQGVEKFGGIDILVNNASAISLTNTAKTAMKRYDLMHQVNVRGTFLCSQACLPHLQQASNPHILNISPPLNMDAKWFAQHVAYTMTKYGMSMCVLGMAQEFAGRIAVNALWPKTTIATAAIEFALGGDAMMRKSRSPEIMADTAHWILTQDAKTVTGNFFIDEDIMVQQGVTDLSHYAIDPSQPLMPDFFL